MRSLLARMLDTFRRRALDREIDNEIAVHLELATSEMEAGGMNRDAARKAALRDFGGVARAMEADRDVRSFPALEHLRADLRDALRGFRRTPTTTIVLILTIAIGIGIGVTTAIFGVVYGVLLKPSITYIGVSIALAVVTLVATYLPARRASRVQPVTALRSSV